MLFSLRPAPCRQEHDGNLARSEILLMLQVLVGCNQNLESGCFCLLKELAILQHAPVLLKSGADLMRCEKPPQRNGRSLVEQNPHSSTFQ